MILAMAVLLFQFPVVAGAANSPQRPSAQPTVESRSSAAPAASDAADSPGIAAVTSEDHPKSNVQPVQPMAELAGTFAMPDLYLPRPPAFRPPDEAPVTHRKWWIVLSTTEHSSAAFDAWSTRYALLNGRVEADPVMRPFAGSPAIYGAVQVIPVGLDYLAHRLQRSSSWTRHVWWVPQSMAAATFLFSGSYNVAHTN
ncbi:MAG: hypothetical protein WBE86_17110 [Candidatus Acidiferrales bacterium]